MKIRTTLQLFLLLLRMAKKLLEVDHRPRPPDLILTATAPNSTRDQRLTNGIRAGAAGGSRLLAEQRALAIMGKVRVRARMRLMMLIKLSQHGVT